MGAAAEPGCSCPFDLLLLLLLLVDSTGSTANLRGALSPFGRLDFEDVSTGSGANRRAGASGAMFWLQWWKCFDKLSRKDHYYLIGNVQRADWVCAQDRG